MTIAASNGSSIFIGTTTSAENLSQFLTDSYTEIGEVEDLGEFGDESEIITFASLADNRNRKLKGIRDAGTLTLVVGDDPSDTGQDALITAEADTLAYNFKVVLNDAVTVSGTPSEHYFRAFVTSKRQGVGSANNVVRRTFNLAVDTAIISVDPT